jgi:putative two-component system response regulator
MAIADVYDALRSTRPYKVAFSHEKSVEIIRESSGSHFDPQVVDVFLEICDLFAGVGRK